MCKQCHQPLPSNYDHGALFKQYPAFSRRYHGILPAFLAGCARSLLVQSLVSYPRDPHWSRRHHPHPGVKPRLRTVQPVPDRIYDGPRELQRRREADELPFRRHLRLATSSCHPDCHFGGRGETGEPGPIFCRFPVITRSVSATPFALTKSPSAEPSVTSFCSALPSAPTT
jgi:hypothetical protein